MKQEELKIETIGEISIIGLLENERESFFAALLENIIKLSRER